MLTRKSEDDLLHHGEIFFVLPRGKLIVCPTLVIVFVDRQQLE
jgi:hypothetical protein